ncbi:hypothetical protein FA13DRAFT_1779278 [Coprinellus micaceus]|uniref:DUF6534 domain-containing protein n=1 Tax=Coprinellus micaceus TaxID=71717 RepID=A0A4Y7SI34_COPMI|nr:hypothetical protein FA13DRAFT_1779278 [Coprinellus micaceus]
MPDSRYPLRFEPTFKNFAGSQMLAAIVTTMLNGVALFMVLRYLSSHSRNDPLWIKIVVCALGVLATLETAFTDHWMYQYFILDQSALDHRGVIYFSIPAKTICVFLVAFLSQMFYASRIWRVGSRFETRLRWAVIPIAMLSLLQLGGGLIQVVIMTKSKLWSVLNELVWYNIRSMYIHGCSAAACDILITATLVTILRRTEANATRRCVPSGPLILAPDPSFGYRTKSLLERLIVYAINRGAVACILALLAILLYDLASGTLYYLIPFSSNTQVYVISVVSMLNSREGLRENVERTFHLSDLIASNQTSGTGGTNQSSTMKYDGETDLEASREEDHPEQRQTFEGPAT